MATTDQKSLDLWGWVAGWVIWHHRGCAETFALFRRGKGWKTLVGYSLTPPVLPLE